MRPILAEYLPGICEILSDKGFDRLAGIRRAEDVGEVHRGCNRDTPCREHVLHHLLGKWDHIFDPVPVEALITVFDVDLCGPEKAVLDRVSDMGDCGRHSPNAELAGVQIRDHVQDREDKVLQGAVLNAEIERGAELVRVRTLALENQPDLLPCPFECVQAECD